MIPFRSLSLSLLLTVAQSGVAALPAGAAVSRAGAPMAMRAVAPADGELRLSRAAMESARGNARGVIEQLEGLDFTTGPAFAGADRAAFLLGDAYRETGDTRRHEALVSAVSGWQQTTVFTAWLLARPAVAPAAPPDTASVLGRDLAGAERIRNAARALARGDVPAAERLLASVPAGSRHAARALHMQGLVALEQGDAARGSALLGASLAADSQYAGAREARLALGGAAFDLGRWDDARRHFDAADRDRNAQHAELLALRSSGDFTSLWPAWQARPDSSDVLVVDGAAAREQERRAARAATDLRARAIPAPSAPVAVAHAGAAAPAAMPGADEWRMVSESASALAFARAEAERSRWAVERESTQLADRRRYLTGGLDSLRRLDARLVPGQALLDSLRGSLEELQARLRDVRDEEKRRVARRTAALLEACERQDAWARGMQRLHVAGPDSAHWLAAPEGMPSAASVLARELALTASLRALAQNVAALAPGWLDRSYERAWGPGLVDRAVAQAADARRSRVWARVLDRSVDSSRTASAGSPALASAMRRSHALASRADSLERADAALRSRVAREAVDRTLAALEREREGIDYGRAMARYAVAVQLDASDSLLGSARAGKAAAPERQVDEAEDADAAVLRAAALPVMQAFLARHPGSSARAEMRFRLADLELVQARAEFRERMAAFLRRQESGASSPGAVPVLDPTRALALYRRMLAEDAGYAHLDAVRFNSGMILAEAGEPEARRFFADLVATSPSSPYCQEAWLRMGDMAFDEKRFAEAAPLYARASEGGEPTLAAIASYKLGWAHFNQDHFEPAADAFRAVLDLYEQRRADVHVDIEGEAEAYFVHALAGAGGAAAFARYFDRVGHRPYERRVLLALGQQFRRYGELGSAAGTDQLVLDRYPAAPEALLAAQRQVATFQRADNAGQVRRAQRELAPRFLPRGEWARAQASDSLRRAGEQFAHDSYLAIARSHHDRAAATRDSAEWASARVAYETLLEQWPDDPGAAALRLDAGKASAQSGDARAALRYFAAVAKRAPDSLASAAMVQAVATTDAWYERTRGTRAAGTDSLARQVIEHGDALRERFPSHALAADVTWRQAQLAVAHHWDDRAARDLSAFAKRWPADGRAPLAALQNGEALFRLERFEAAGEAFEIALGVARSQKRDSLERRAARALPLCAYRAADAAVAADSNAHADHARRFEHVAARWPAYEDAALSQYRAARSWQLAGRPRDAVRAYGVLLERHPRGEFARESRLQVARSWEALGDSAEAGAAYLSFSAAESDPDNAAAAWLRAADLYASAGRVARADSLRLEYVRRHPADVEAAMAIYEGLARRDIAAVGPGRPVSALLATPARGKGAAPARSHLAEYLRRAKAQPALGSRELVAHVRFLLAEESREACAAVALTQPLARSVAARKTLLDSTLARYRRCADLAVPVWAHASAFRIGETLQEFASALEHSQAPPDLAGDDLLAYRDVLAEKARPFANRGQDVWAELLRQNPAPAPADEWVARAREQLVQKLATRFYFQPEIDFPLLDAQSPNPSRASRASEREGASR